MKVTIVSFGVGNVGSVCQAFYELGVETVVAADPVDLNSAECVVLPGVGSFSDSMTRLRSSNWVEPLRQHVVARNKPILGICLGMQLLATFGDEGGGCPGLDLLGGSVRRLSEFGCNLRLPHVGWNNIKHLECHQLFSGIPQQTDVYFVHSYAFGVTNADHVVATVDYGVPVVAAVHYRNVFGTQFHPEKSSKAGRRLLRNFLDHARC
jgi:imidazole glycerol-phosphate synthase subunit HisH